MSGDRSGTVTIHATAVRVADRGVLIRGRSGAGKSALALELIDDPRNAALLVADDQVVLRNAGDGIMMSAPAALAGLIEIRGIGIVRLAPADETPLSLVVDLLPAEACIRHPDDSEKSATVLGTGIPRLTLAIGATATAARIRLALANWAMSSDRAPSGLALPNGSIESA